MNAIALSTHSQDCEITKLESNELVPMAPTEDNQLDRSSSDDDDVPLRTRRPVMRETVREREDDMATCRPRNYCENIREQKDYASHDRDRPTQHELPKPAPKSIEKGQRKKPGPRPWAAKPIMKNDMVAKMEIIREIEGLWGKNFIKTYIPKCHHPLVKRGKVGKRSIYREHETDPKNWLPSVLKAILMIAKLTQNKSWLKKAMNDVVRYRIKNTGNRKPQLVTTDFDVIEDMLVKEWTVPYSFEIRYKHLLVNRKDQEETDEDIDHILGVGSDQADRSEDDDDDHEVEDMKDQVKVEGDGGEEGSVGYSGIPGQHMEMGSYTDPALYPMPALRQQQNQQKPRKNIRYEIQRSPQEMYGYGGIGRGYGPTIDPWGRPIPGYLGPGSYGRYGAYDMPYENHGYGLAQYPGRDSRGRQSSQQPPTRGTPQFPPHHLMEPPPSSTEYGYHERTDNFNVREPFSPFNGDRHIRESYEQTPSFDMESRAKGRRGYLDTSQGSRQMSMSHKSPEFGDRIPSPDVMNDPSNDAGEEAIDAELAAAELQLKSAQLRVKKAALRKQQAKIE